MKNNMRLIAMLGLTALVVRCSFVQAFKKHVSGVDDISVTKKVVETRPKPVAVKKKVEAPLPPPKYHPQRSPLDSVESDQVGSLWNEKGQDNFYFSKNVRRRVGDIIILKVGSDIDETLGDKFNAYFSKLAAKAAAAQAKNKNATSVALPPADSGEKVEVGDVTMRLEKSLDRGSFEVSGQKTIYSHNKKFDVAIQGIVKLEDINADDTIPSSRLLDSKIVLGGID